MQKIINGLLLSLMTTAAAAQGTVTVKGNITGDSKGYNKIYVYGQNIKTDSTVVENGVFSFSIPYKPGIIPTFYTEYESKTTRGVSPFPVMIDGPCDLVLTGADFVKGLHTGTWSGNASAVDYQVFGRGMGEVNAQIKKEMQAKYPGKDYKDSVYRTEYEVLSKQKSADYFLDFVKAHPDSYASIVALRSNRTGLADGDLEKIFRMLSKKQQETAPGKDIADYIVGVKNSTNGSKVKDFTLLTPEEKNLTFSSLKGKYVVIDFWASWCGPCKASFPHMKEVYTKYKGDKFEIYSISIDKDKEAWLKELKKQELPWLQTLDTKNISQSGFAVTAVPTTYLIGPDGKIMMKEIGFDPKGGALEKKLDEVLGKN